MASRFDCIQTLPDFELNELSESFDLDAEKDKINLFTKTCRTEDGSAWTMKWVKQVEHEMAKDPEMNHEYHHPLGDPLFTNAATRFLLGDTANCITEGRADGVQTPGGTLGLRMALELLSCRLNFKRFYLSSPTPEDEKHVYGNSRLIEFLEYYFYWDPATRNINFEDLLENLKKAEEDSVVVLQICSHNPTGCDLTRKQWVQIANVMQDRKLFPLFDSAYQGLASGDPNEDAWPVRYFADRGFELICNQTFSIIAGLYDCRIGHLTFVVNDKTIMHPLLSEMAWIAYTIYGSPNNHGAKIVISVFENPKLRSEWLSGLKKMSNKLVDIRSNLRKRLMLLDSDSDGDWSHLTEQTGLFSYVGLTEEQVEYLKNCHIYLEKNGCINISCLNKDNIDYFARCVLQAKQKYPSAMNNNNTITTST